MFYLSKTWCRLHVHFSLNSTLIVKYVKPPYQVLWTVRFFVRCLVRVFRGVFFLILGEQKLYGGCCQVAIPIFCWKFSLGLFVYCFTESILFSGDFYHYCELLLLTIKPQCLKKRKEIVTFQCTYNVIQAWCKDDIMKRCYFAIGYLNSICNEMKNIRIT